jgi:hypothetical protein
MMLCAVINVQGYWQDNHMMQQLEWLIFLSFGNSIIEFLKNGVSQSHTSESADVCYWTDISHNSLIGQ